MVKYKCGHEHKNAAIVMNTTIESLSAYFTWRDTTGPDGDQSECFDCFCDRLKESQKKYADVGSLTLKNSKQFPTEDEIQAKFEKIDFKLLAKALSCDPHKEYEMLKKRNEKEVDAIMKPSSKAKKEEIPDGALVEQLSIKCNQCNGHGEFAQRRDDGIYVPRVCLYCNGKGRIPVIDKTMRDLIGCDKRGGPEGSYCSNCGMNHMITEECLKKIVILWIKEDAELGKKQGIIKTNPVFGCLPTPYGIMLVRWMRRFNITDADLK